MVARQAGRTHTFYFIHPTTSKPIAFDRVNQPLLERRYKQLNDPDIWHSSHRGLSDRAHILVQDSYWPDSDAVTVDFHRMCVHAPSESGVMEKYRICRVKLDWEQEDMLKALQEQTPRDAMIREHRDRMMMMEVDRESTVDGLAFPPQSSTSSFTTSLGLSSTNPEQALEDRESAQSPLPSRRSSSMYGLARRRSMMLAAGLGNPENVMMSRRRSHQLSPNTPDVGTPAVAPTATSSDSTVYRSVRIDDDAAVQALVSRMRRAHQRSSLAQMQRSHRSTPNSGSTTQSNSPSLSPTLHSDSSNSSLWHRRLSVAAGHSSPSSTTPLRQYMDRRLSAPNNSVIRNMIMSELAAVQQQLHTPPLVASPRHRSEASGGSENDTHTEAGIATIEDASTYRPGDDSTLSD
ncbi:hypothetical protein INT43_005402 [Umbelopsis isabellina]|uniref:Uncharacterized protein n=1 Tax=Mortierella isabellina TaxID=91625 RepID=A0A8H7UE68_MORIS|nr:hypothetical protein INT43_005402 [Umbelopsis isabellina]